jgi:enoyl-CoA hydratase/carnithine racemase
MEPRESSRWLEKRVEGGVVVAQLNRPPANALTVDFLGEIESNFQRLEADAETRGVVLKGYEKVFSAGMDLKMLATLNDVTAQTEVVDALNRTYGAMYAFRKPLVAAVSGHAIAGGLFFLLAADYRIGCEGGAQFGLSEVRVGVAFPVAPLEIVRAELPAPVARRILLSGQPVGVDDALAGGILDEVVSVDALDERALVKAGELAASPPQAYAQVKAQLREPVMAKIRAAIDAGNDPMRAGWFTPETTKAALEVLSGKR